MNSFASAKMMMVLAAFFLGIVPHANADVILIDNFSAPAANTAVYKGIDTSPQSLTTAGAGILGGERELTFSSSSSPFGLGNDGSVGGGKLESFSGINSVTTKLVYDGVGSGGFAGQNFTDGTFGLFFGFFDTGVPINTEIRIVINGTSTAIVTVNDSGVPFDLKIPTSLFSDQGALSNVTKIEVIINDGATPGAGVDFVLNSITFSNAPEPSSIAIFGSMLIGSGLVWIRKRRKS